MGLINSASSASAWRGYEYYKENKVCSIKKINEDEYEGTVSGSLAEPYSVYINIAHPKKSTCTCPFAEGNRKVCKHKVALYFSAFPEEAEKYLAEVEQAEKEAEEYEEELYDRVLEKISKMKKAELQEALWQVLMDAPEWVFDRFARDYIEY